MKGLAEELCYKRENVEDMHNIVNELISLSTKHTKSVISNKNLLKNLKRVEKLAVALKESLHTTS